MVGFVLLNLKLSMLYVVHYCCSINFFLKSCRFIFIVDIFFITETPIQISRSCPYQRLVSLKSFYKCARPTFPNYSLTLYFQLSKHNNKTVLRHTAILWQSPRHWREKSEKRSMSILISKWLSLVTNRTCVTCRRVK